MTPGTNVRATGPGAGRGTSLVPQSGNRLPVASSSSGASNLPATRGGSITAAPSGGAKASSGFTYSRLGDVEIGAAKGSAVATARSLATKIAGRALGVAGLAVPDSTKREPGNPVFRKTDAGQTQVAGYRSSTTPRAGTSDVNTQSRMVGDMSRRSGMAPSVKNQEIPSKIAPVQTKEPGTMSAPKTASSTTPAKAPSKAQVKEPVSRSDVVPKADLDTYRTNVGNKNATLGQYMNDLKDKTAIAGGRNDPSVIQKTLKGGEKAFDPTSPTGQYSGNTSAVPRVPPPPSDVKASVSSAPAASAPLPPRKPAGLQESVMVGSNKYRIV